MIFSQKSKKLYYLVLRKSFCTISSIYPNSTDQIIAAKNVRKHFPVMNLQVLEQVKKYSLESKKRTIKMLDCTIGTGGHSL